MEENWTIVIKPKTGWFELNLKELISYKDLVFLFVKRNFSVQYKQTILGPLWFIINPLLSTFIYSLIFGTVAGMSTDGAPQFAFYLCGVAIWQYFSACVVQTSNTFVSNASVFGKVYFPRITVPIATVIFSFINFFVVFIMSLLTNIFYMCNGADLHISSAILLVPVLVIQTALLGLGFGVIVSSLTTKYRDLGVLVSFGIQLWMYATPVVYSVSQFSSRLGNLIMLNPISPIVCNFRYAMLGTGYLDTFYWGISAGVTVAVLIIGIVLFNHVEKTFMDTV